jgi:hypothetical protein
MSLGIFAFTFVGKTILCGCIGVFIMRSLQRIQLILVGDFVGGAKKRAWLCNFNITACPTSAQRGHWSILSPVALQY